MLKSIESYGFVIIPEKLIQDDRLTPMSRLVFGKIYSLSISNGYCWATNGFFANYFKISIRTIGKCISELAKYNYIRVVFNRREVNQIKRKIFIIYESLIL